MTAPDGPLVATVAAPWSPSRIVVYASAGAEADGAADDGSALSLGTMEASTDGVACPEADGVGLAPDSAAGRLSRTTASRTPASAPMAITPPAASGDRERRGDCDAVIGISPSGMRDS